MTYNPSIPQGTQNLSASQVAMLTNFTQLNTIFDTNHYTWNDATTANRGKHRKIDFPVPESANPSPTGDASAIYAKLVSGVAQAFFANSSGVQQLSLPTISSSGSNYGVTLGNGLILNFGLSPSVSSGGNATITYAVPFTTSTYSAVATSFDQDGRMNLSVSPNGLTQLKVYATNISGSGSHQAYYIAIGK